MASATYTPDMLRDLVQIAREAGRPRRPIGLWLRRVECAISGSHIDASWVYAVSVGVTDRPVCKWCHEVIK